MNPEDLLDAIAALPDDERRDLLTALAHHYHDEMDMQSYWWPGVCPPPERVRRWRDRLPRRD